MGPFDAADGHALRRRRRQRADLHPTRMGAQLLAGRRQVRRRSAQAERESSELLDRRRTPPAHEKGREGREGRSRQINLYEDTPPHSRPVIPQRGSGRSPPAQHRRHPCR